MSILHYFKKSSSCTKDSLPDPTGPLSEKVPSKVIVTANPKVTNTGKLLKSIRGPYLTLTPEQKLRDGRRTMEYGTTTAI